MGYVNIHYHESWSKTIVRYQGNHPLPRQPFNTIFEFRGVPGTGILRPYNDLLRNNHTFIHTHIFFIGLTLNLDTMIFQCLEGTSS